MVSSGGNFHKFIGEEYKQILKIFRCPVCYSDKADRLWGVNSKQAAQHFILHEKHPERFAELKSHIENLWGQNTCEVVQCKNCEFCYSNPYIAGDERFYNLAYDHSGYPKWKWEFQLTYEVLRKISKKDHNLLEIGAGNGSFIKKIIEKYLPKENIVCTEFSKVGNQHIEKLGVKCFTEDVRDFSNAELAGNFDIVCMFQVLEHMDRLDLLFRKLNWLIKSGGSLFISIPNPKKIEFNEINGALLDMPPNHIGRWNKKCFDLITKRNGFHVKDYKIEVSILTSLAKQFVIYRYLRKSQQYGSIENKIQTIKNYYQRKIMQIISLSINSIMAIPSFTKKDFREGNSQWTHLIKM